MNIPDFINPDAISNFPNTGFMDKKRKIGMDYHEYLF